jgi:hypothetical protein
MENDRADTPVNTAGACALLASIGFTPRRPSIGCALRVVSRFLKHGSRVFYRPSALRSGRGKTRELSNTSEAIALALNDEPVAGGNRDRLKRLLK